MFGGVGEKLVFFQIQCRYVITLKEFISRGIQENLCLNFQDGDSEILCVKCLGMELFLELQFWVIDFGGLKFLEVVMLGVDFLLGKILIEVVIVNKGYRLEVGLMYVVFFLGYICFCVQRFEGKVIWKFDFLFSVMYNMYFNFININNLCQLDLEIMFFTFRMLILFGYYFLRLLLWCSVVQLGGVVDVIY